MGEDESDEHLKIFECLVNTGALVLRSSLERKVLHNIPITFEQYLENTKHQFYHQFERNRNKSCCSGQPHNCYFNGNMDKKIFYKVYNKISESNKQHCLDRFEVRPDVSIDKLDLSDLNFFLWNSNTLSQQEVQSLQTIMTIRSAICHPQSSHCYSINDLEQFWISLQNAVLLFAEPDSYKKIVTFLITTQKRSKVNEIESNRIINEMHTESEHITHELKLEVQTRNDCTNQLMKDESVGIKNCINNTCDKTKSCINEKVQKLTESENRVCQTVIHSGGRLEDKLTEQQNEIRTQNMKFNADIMEDNRKLRAEVMDVKTEIKHVKELTTILIGYIGKQKVDLVMNTEQIEKSTESPDKRKVDMTAKICQTFVTEDKENEIIENLPPEVKSPTYNDCSQEAALTDTIEITGKRVNSIILELKATPGILHSVDNFKAAILTLVQVMQTAGGIDVDIEDTVTVNLKFESPLTEDQFAVVKCLFANDSNGDNDTTQLSDECSFISDECSSISDEYLSTAAVEKIESPSELDIYSQKETSEVVQPESTEAFTEPSCKYCDDKDNIIRTLEEEHELLEMFKTQKEQYMGELISLRAETRTLEYFVKGLKEENSKLKGQLEENIKLKQVVKGLREEIIELKGTDFVKKRGDDIGIISISGKLGMKTDELKSEDVNRLEHTYDLLRQAGIDDTGMLRKLRKNQKDLKSHDISSLEQQQTHYLSSKTIVDECRNCYEKDEIIIQLDRRLCEIRRRAIEAKTQSVSGNNYFEDLLQFIHQTTNMTSVEEKEGMTYKELKSGIYSKKSELISDVDIRDPEKKANKKLMESQASQGRRPELDQTEEKSELSLRISEIRREYASNYYTKTDKQKGLGIIVHEERSSYYRHARDPHTTHLQEFFEEIGFVVKCTKKSDWRQFFQYMIDGKFYCVFIVLRGYREDADEYRILHLLSQRSIGKPVIIMTDFTSPLLYMIQNNEDNDILTVMPTKQGRRGPYGYLGEMNIYDDFVKATRRNRFADIMDILTRMNALYDYPIITFLSSLRKKFCFL
ncbi:uncharacterized protein LOC143055298 isoform X2 [Mytilus galloprovincialis]|uniref:uncharacterized protein LOC143055298 isoform X2 n=1 Tax=Mytilus galloprovincialis TaxID=29158 RepID=UPI003F7C81DD